MVTDLLFRQIQDLKRNLNVLEVSIGEINNAIFLLEERMFDIDDNHFVGVNNMALERPEDAY